MIKYTIIDGSPLDIKLTAAYTEAINNSTWSEFIKHLDENIIMVKYLELGDTEITFMHEEELTFFILRWS